MPDEMTEAHRKDMARSARMRAVRDAIDDAKAEGDFSGFAIRDTAQQVRSYAQDTMDHIVAVWD